MAASPDASLAGGPGGGGLSYPFAGGVPAFRTIGSVAPGIGWLRQPVPGPLGHINCWVLDDRDAAGEGIAIADSGLDLPECRANWEALFAGPLAGRRVTRVFATHFHPDHAGLAGWLCERFGVALWMTRTEWLQLRLLGADRTGGPTPALRAWWRLAGYSDSQMAAAAEQGWSSVFRLDVPAPASVRRIVDGETIAIGERTWRVVVGTGHTPEHACLVDEDGGVMIAGDQLLPRITTNVSIQVGEPDGDPLGDWLASIEKLATLPPGLLVLPAHGEPFTGLHARLDALRDDHRERLAALAAGLDRPMTAVDSFPLLFRRTIGDDLRRLAAGEALAHLRRLARDGRAIERREDGVARFVRA